MISRRHHSPGFMNPIEITIMLMALVTVVIGFFVFRYRHIDRYLTPPKGFVAKAAKKGNPGPNALLEIVRDHKFALPEKPIDEEGETVIKWKVYREGGDLVFKRKVGAGIIVGGLFVSFIGLFIGVMIAAAIFSISTKFEEGLLKKIISVLTVPPAIVVGAVPFVFFFSTVFHCAYMTVSTHEARFTPDGGIEFRLRTVWPLELKHVVVKPKQIIEMSIDEESVYAVWKDDNGEQRAWRAYAGKALLKKPLEPQP